MDQERILLRSGVCLIFIVIVTFSASALAYDWQTNPGNGTEADPYQISEPNHLIAIGADPNLLDKCFILTNNIVFDPNNNPAHVFTAAIISPDTTPDDWYYTGTAFTGSFDGAGFTIQNVKIAVPSGTGYYVGLFGTIGMDAEVRHLGLESVNITGADPVGGLAGVNGWGYIISCYTTGTVQGTGMGAGGLVGDNRGLIWNCRSSCTVAGDAVIGGLTGFNSAEILACQSTGKISGSRDFIGGLTGKNDGSISGSVASGSVAKTGDEWGGNIGGLAGNSFGTITNCYASGSVAGGANSSMVGGFAGQNNGSISDCYATGSVSGEYSVGGLLGINEGSLSTCFSTGSVNGTSGYEVGGLIGANLSYEPVLSCYYLDTSGPDNGFGTPLDDPNMMIQANFSGWDFVGESTNGENEIWRMCVDGVDYPRLSWQFAQNGDFACADGVDLADLQSLAEQWLTAADTTPTTFNHACDANGNEQIDLNDFAVLSENWP